MNNNSLVSIIVPIYKVEQYLKDCIDSIIRQDYKNIELILIDDGSPDNSGKIADQYALLDQRIHVIHKLNEGVAAARNDGIKISKGEFITFVDSDDWISQDYISHLISLQKKDDSDMCMTTEFFVNRTDKNPTKIKIKTISPCNAAALLLSPHMVVGSCNKLYRRRWLEECKIKQNQNLFSGEGLHFTVTSAQHANHVTISNKRIYFYRRNVQESATTKFNVKMFTNNELSLDLIKKEKIVSNPFFESMLSLFSLNLKINGLLALISNSAQSLYSEEYTRWASEIKKIGKKLLLNKYVPIKSKIRIMSVILVPELWAYLAKKKRAKIFKESV